MKIYSLFFLAILFSANINAQATSNAQTSKQTKPAGNSTDSLKQAMANLKALFGGKKDTITITVDNVDYDDTDLEHLKDGIKNFKGAKPLSAQYKSGNEIMEVLFKGASTNLWDNLPADVKKPFKLVEATNNTISLKLKSAKASP